MPKEAPERSVLGPYYTRIMLGEYSRPRPFEKTEFIPKAYVFLPIPSELRDDSFVNWSSENLDTVGDVLNGQAAAGAEAAALARSGNLVGYAGGVVMDVLGADLDTVAQGLGRVTDNITSGARSLVNLSQITSAVQAETGLAPNPNPTVTFQGPDLRSYSYSWTFYPHNPEESKQTQRMITILKSRSLAQNSISKSASILKYPNIAQVNFYPWDKGGKAPWYWSNDSIIKYKRSVIQAVNVNYAPFGTPGFFAGTNLPTTIQLSITFKEIEYMLANDWDPALEGNESIGGATTKAISAVGKTLEEGLKDVGTELGKIVL